MSSVFSKESLQYLTAVYQNNSREWYLQHKAAYDTCLLKPFQRLVRELTPTMLKIDSQVETTPAVDKTISRIYRDTRFSSDKSLYRDKMWFTFLRKTRERTDSPAFFFEISPVAYRYGMGFFSASTATMDSYRDRIMEEEKSFGKIIAKIKTAGVFVLEGELYKKNRYTGKMAGFAEWYNRKNIFLVDNQMDIEQIFDFDVLLAQLRDGFVALSELYAFVLAASAARRPGVKRTKHRLTGFQLLGRS